VSQSYDKYINQTPIHAITWRGRQIPCYFVGRRAKNRTRKLYSLHRDIRLLSCQCRQVNCGTTWRC